MYCTNLYHILLQCLLIASTVLAKPRPKRTLGYIKNLIKSKLFGTNTVVITRPILAKNESHQLFKIPGFDDILIKVSRNENKRKPNEAEEKHKVKHVLPVDAVMVKPDIAIIGSYLGTTTQKETLFAIEMVNSLLKSGILTGRRNDSIQDLVVPMIPQSLHFEYIDEKNIPVLPLQVFAEEQGHVLVPMSGQQVDVGNPYAIPVSPEKRNPFLSKYIHKQKGNEGDMTYEFNNNKDVIVTRTEKEPPLPQLIKLRTAEVANIGATPYLIRSLVNPYSAFNTGMAVSENVQPPEILPYISHRIAKPSNIGVVESEHFGNNVYGGPILVDQNPLSISEPLPVDTVVGPCYFGNNMKQVIQYKVKSVAKVCPHGKVQMKTNQNQHIASNISGESKPSQEVVVNIQNDANKGETNVNRLELNEFLKNHSVISQLVAQYVYKQMNHHSQDNYTEVKVGENPKLTKDILVETRAKNFQKDFVFIPPKAVDAPLASVLSLNDQEKTSNHGQNDGENVFTSVVKLNKIKHKQYFIPSAPRLKSNEEPKHENYLKLNPIVVAELFVNENVEKRSSTENVTNETDDVEQNAFDENSKRGDIPGS